jgi:hypothetical protein
MKPENDPTWKREYLAWQDMLARCYHPTHPDYPQEGGRGIKVCARWRFGEHGKNGFACFLDDMGPMPDDDALVSAVVTDEIERGNAVVIASDRFAIDDAGA